MTTKNPLTRTARAAAAGMIGLGIAAAGTFAAASPAHASTLGERSLATVLAADSGFDSNSSDFDILDAAVGAVLAAKPTSPVAVLADGSVPLTAFLPTDGAFRTLLKDLTGRTVASESGVFSGLAAVVPVDTLEAVLLYHVSLDRLDAKAVLASNKAKVTTAGGGTITVKVGGRFIKLVDNDPSARDPRVVTTDINAGNKQIAHSIDRVLRPIDL